MTSFSSWLGVGILITYLALISGHERIEELEQLTAAMSAEIDRLKEGGAAA